jgi:ABC-2 type transport system ATP-binding protein
MSSTKDDIAIQVEHVSKDFILPHEKTTSVKSGLINAFRSGKKTKEVQHVLKGISFEVKKGEFLGIVGRNGCGKSTLLKILSQIYQPTKGNVKVNGKLVPFIELGVGFNPELTGRENVFLNGALLGFSRKEIEERYDEIVKFAELEEFMDQKLKNYSSGMQVRLAFSVAIRAEGDILVLDEVLAVGDEAFQRKCFNYFTDLKKNKKTVILVTHSMDNVRKHCNKALMIRDGNVATYGSPEDVSNEYSMDNFANQAPEVLSEKAESKFVKDLTVKINPNKLLDEKTKLNIRITYTLTKIMPTRLKLSVQDIGRNVTVMATNSDVINSENVDLTLSVDLSALNDADLRIAVSVRDANYEMLYFLPEALSPIIQFKRKDYTDPKNKTTWAVLFDRGEWTEL